MRKVTDFIVNNRYLILFVSIILTIISIYVSNEVKVNNDMSKYLPSDSETRIGKDIMEKEFDNSNSNLNVLLKDLSQQQKNEAYDYLKNIDHITKVDEEEKDNLILYSITTDVTADSKDAKKIYNNIEEHFEENIVDTSGNISDENKVVLPFYVIVVAVSSALVILVIMCESYLEPFLFLITILIAVALNNGTNIIFPNISNITKSISSILQMALSMDYSIMLMNRYRQEKEVEKDKVKAMKNALYNAFKSISSSSVTTIVGLIALVFMSFTIGRDLGLVLAKGVLFSLISIFSCLPAFIIMTDTLLTKTKKKSPIVKLDFMGKFNYKFKYLVTFLFVAIFIISFFLKGNLGYVYNATEKSEITKNFKVNNQIAIVYPNNKEKEMSKYCESLEDENNKISDVLCYGNTINQPLKYDKINKKLDDLDSSITIDDYLLKIIYYHYYNEKEDNKIALNDIINFIKTTIYENENMSKDIDNDMRENIDILYNFSNKNEIQKQRTIKEIANTLKIDEKEVKNILIYYNSKKINSKMTLSQFINFMNSDVINNPNYNKDIDSNTKNNLNKISKFISKDVINKNLNSNEASQLFNIDKNTMESLYAYYNNFNSNNLELSINEFVNFVLNDVSKNEEYASLIDDSMLSNLKVLKQYSDKDFINKKVSLKELSTLFTIDENTLSNIVFLIKSQQESNLKITISDFINSVMYLKENTNYLDELDFASLKMLFESEEVKKLIAENKTYSCEELSNILGLDKNDINKIYILIEITNNNELMSPYELVSNILNNELISIPSNMNEQLQTLYFVMNSTINNQKYTYKELASYLKINEDKVNGIYSLYSSNSLTITPYELVNFILNHKDDEMLKNKMSSNTINELDLLNKIMTSVINNKKYSSSEISKLLGIDKESTSLIYSLYYTKNNELSISYQEFVKFLLSDIINNKKYNSNITEDKKDKITILNNIINNSLKNKTYNKDELFEILSPLSSDLDKDLIDLVYIYYGSVNDYDNDWTLTIEKMVNYLNNNIIKDKRFDNYISDKKEDILESKDTIKDAKKMLVGKNYSRAVINTELEIENEETFNYIKKIKDDIKDYGDNIYVIGDSPMSYEMSQTFDNELNFITILTMLFIFVVVAITFKSILIPIILVLIIQTAVYFTMTILSLSGSVYFISILVVQSILMGATIDYAILYTSYYLEERQRMGIKESLIKAYNDSIHTILTSSSILIIVTLVVGKLSSAISAKICTTISEGTFFSATLILLLLPGLLAASDKIITKNKKSK